VKDRYITLRVRIYVGGAEAVRMRRVKLLSPEYVDSELMSLVEDAKDATMTLVFKRKPCGPERGEKNDS